MFVVVNYTVIESASYENSHVDNAIDNIIGSSVVIIKFNDDKLLVRASCLCW